MSEGYGFAEFANLAITNIISDAGSGRDENNEDRKIDEQAIQNKAYCEVARTSILNILGKDSDSKPTPFLNAYAIMNQLNKQSGVYCRDIGLCKSLLESIEGVCYEPFTGTYYRTDMKAKLKKCLNNMAMEAQGKLTQKAIDVINARIMEAASRGEQMVKVWDFQQQPPTNDTALTQSELTLVYYVQDVLEQKAFVKVCVDSNVRYKEYIIVQKTDGDPPLTKDNQEDTLTVSDLPAYSEIRKSLYVQLKLDCFEPIQCSVRRSTLLPQISSDVVYSNGAAAATTREKQ